MQEEQKTFSSKKLTLLKISEIFAKKTIIIWHHIFICWAPLALLSPHAMVLFAGLGIALKKPNFKLILMLILLPLLSVTYATELQLSALNALKFTAIIIIGALFCQKKHAFRSMSWGIYFVLFLITADWLLGNPLQWVLGKSNAKLYAQPSLLIAMSVAGLFYKDILLCSFTLFALLLVDCDSAVLALISGILCSWLGKRILPTFFLGIWFLSISAPFIAKHAFASQNIQIYNHIIKDHSYIHRMYIFQNVANCILKKPLLGYGMNYSHSENLRRQSFSFSYFDKQNILRTYQSPLIPHHPHNFALQLWLEFGALGIAYLSVLWFLLYRYLSRNNHQIGLVVSSIVIAGLSISIWQSWWLVCLAILWGLTTKHNYRTSI